MKGGCDRGGGVCFNWEEAAGCGEMWERTAAVFDTCSLPFDVLNAQYCPNP
jgi:hypothetical protein